MAFYFTRYWVNYRHHKQTNNNIIIIIIEDSANLFTTERFKASVCVCVCQKQLRVVETLLFIDGDEVNIKKKSSAEWIW